MIVAELKISRAEPGRDAPCLDETQQAGVGQSYFGLFNGRAFRTVLREVLRDTAERP